MGIVEGENKKTLRVVNLLFNELCGLERNGALFFLKKSILFSVNDDVSDVVMFY